MKEPSFRNMLLVQISRLNSSINPLDIQLKEFLISTVTDTACLQEEWIKELTEVEKVHKLVKEGMPECSALDIVAKNSKRTTKAIQDQYAEYKDTLIEIDAIFQDLANNDSE